MTVTPRGVYLFGGRGVVGKVVERGLYRLEMGSWVWTRVGPNREEGAWPRGRYFHTMDYWNGKLVLFGGMGVTTTAVPTTSGTACVMDDLWIYDLATGQWEEHTPELPQYTSTPPSPTDLGTKEPVAPVARYAHLSVVVGDRLVVMGGQHLSNE